MIKNKGSHIVQVSATLGTVHGRVPLSDSGAIPSGNSRTIRVPCHVSDFEVTVTDVVRGGSTTLSRRDNFTSECIVWRYPLLTQLVPVHCPLPGVPESNCYKYITFKNEASYIANATAYYVFNGQKWENDIDNITSLQTRNLSIPCDASEVRVRAEIPRIFEKLLEKTYAMPSDDCFILIGTTKTEDYKRYKSCSETKLNISVKNHGAYTTDLTVAYDYHGVRPSHRDTIYAGKTGVITVPSDATNLHVKAKAVAGKTIFEVNLPRAQSLCTKVHGTTLFPKHEPCN